MSDLFKNINISLIKEPMALDYDYQPKLVPYRENQQKHIATCIQPLFQSRNGKNLIITGSPGIGKTVSVKHIIEELEFETDDIIPIYINCWKKDTPNKIALEICEKINYKFTHNKTTDQLLKEITKTLNKKAAVIILDEIDKLQDQQILYSLLEDLYRKTIILITNESSYFEVIDQRIYSRLTPEVLEFKPYNLEETKGILKERAEFAFPSGILSEEAIAEIAKKTFEIKDIRTGLFLLKEAALIAESEAVKKIETKHALNAISKLNQKPSRPIPKEQEPILNLIKEHSGKSTKELFDIYSQNNDISYRTFHRKIEDLTSLGVINTEKKQEKGQTKIIKYGQKALNEF